MTRRTPAGAAVLQPQVTQAITEAVLQEWADKGYVRLSMEGVARRAGVGKSALYRRWPSKQDMVLAVLGELRVAVVAIPDTGSFERDIDALIQSLLDWLSYPNIVPILADMVAETTRDSTIRDAVETLLRAPQRMEAQPIFERAIARGELRSDVDPDLLLELLVSSIYWRIVVRAQPVTKDYIHAVITAIHHGFLPPR